MMATKIAGAPSALVQMALDRWDDKSFWAMVNAKVTRLQMRITKAVEEKRWNKVNSLQWILTHSFFAKIHAVRRITKNKGSRTPGVDKVLLHGPKDYVKMALSLQRRGYRAQPLRRILIPKKHGKFRPLGIPTIKDRCMQALYLLALHPVSEWLADINSYGFRPYRACRDAISQCFKTLSGKNCAVWILEGDIKACFDEIDHEFLLEIIPLDKRMLKQWLKCGFMEGRSKRIFPTKAGTPQGGIISPTLANMVLDGLEERINKALPRRGNRINFVRYADDFIVTAKEKWMLTDVIRPLIEDFLKPRGLQLSEEKTLITHIDNGFDFLSQNMRKFNGKLITQPTKNAVKRQADKLRSIIKDHNGKSTEQLIRRLNPVISGWANFHRYVQSSTAFGKLDTVLYESLMRWCKRRHNNKSTGWIVEKYFRSDGWNNWIFHGTRKDKHGKRCYLDRKYHRDTKLKQYIKIRGKANPFKADEKDYFSKRRMSDNCMATKAYRNGIRKLKDQLPDFP